MSKEEEEVFSSIAHEDSAKEEFKRNHKQVWSFIIKKKKSAESINTSAPPPSHPPSPYRLNNAEMERRRMQKRKLKQQLEDYLRKWKPGRGGPSRSVL